jgi:hypothetical protein
MTVGCTVPDIILIGKRKSGRTTGKIWSTTKWSCLGQLTFFQWLTLYCYGYHSCSVHCEVRLKAQENFQDIIKRLKLCPVRGTNVDRRNNRASTDRNSRALIGYEEHNIALTDGNTPTDELSGWFDLRLNKTSTEGAVKNHVAMIIDLNWCYSVTAGLYGKKFLFYNTGRCLYVCLSACDGQNSPASRDRSSKFP